MDLPESVGSSLLKARASFDRLGLDWLPKMRGSTPRCYEFRVVPSLARKLPGSKYIELFVPNIFKCLKFSLMALKLYYCPVLLGLDASDKSKIAGFCLFELLHGAPVSEAKVPTLLSSSRQREFEPSRSFWPQSELGSTRRVPGPTHPCDGNRVCWVCTQQLGDGRVLMEFASQYGDSGGDRVAVEAEFVE